jgi:uncharacterized protein (DUF4415 family)
MPRNVPPKRARNSNDRRAISMNPPLLILPTPEEDAAVNRGIAADPDTYELSAREIAELKPLGTTRRMGRPPKEKPKEQVSVRYDADVLEAFRATGEGWQTRMNDALRAYLKEHPLKAA